MKRFILFLSFLIINCQLSIATIRYVSHSGTSTPPYTTWETAADSIQKCIDYSFAGDTIIVANGTYYESLIIDKYLSLIGSSMDSTIIDGTGLNIHTIEVQSDCDIKGFCLIGKNMTDASIIECTGYNFKVSDCHLKNSFYGIYIGICSGKIDRVIITNVNNAVTSFCWMDTCHPVISNSVLLLEHSLEPSQPAIEIFNGGNPIITNNLITGKFAFGIDVGYSARTMIVKNNIITGFGRANIHTVLTQDSAIIENNIVGYQITTDNGSIQADNSRLTNNIIIHNGVGIKAQGNVTSKYNLLWDNNENIVGATLDSTNIVANPMFVNDTIPVYGGTYDYHLQKYSPAIDAGDPSILDVDGSRSDIGVFGGPLGETYTYQDLAPRPPVNLIAIVDTNELILTWKKNTEADFKSYRIYRDTTEGFIIDSTKIISEQSDTFFIQILPNEEINLYYKITAVDSQGNQSGPSEEVHVVLSGIVNKEKLTINDYHLYQNYPNPFNPSTKIGYKLKEKGYVKLMVYDIKGEMIEILVNKVQDKGYYEIEFGNQAISQLASGIYLYRIEVIGKGNIPLYSDMKKMILLK